MIEGRCRSSLSSKALKSLGISREIVRKKLQCDVTPKFEIFGLIDYPHPTAAQFPQHAVTRKGLAYELGAKRHEREYYGPRTPKAIGKGSRRSLGPGLSLAAILCLRLAPRAMIGALLLR